MWCILPSLNADHVLLGAQHGRGQHGFVELLDVQTCVIDYVSSLCLSSKIPAVRSFGRVVAELWKGLGLKEGGTIGFLMVSLTVPGLGLFGFTFKLL